MNSIGEQYQSGERPVPLTSDQLAEIHEALPAGSIVIGGLNLSSGSRPSVPKESEMTTTDSACVIVIYALDDHTIHKGVICQTGPHDYEIISDEVVGAW